jgi:hypothetical protein
MKTVSDKLFPVMKELELQGVFKQFDVVMTWNQDNQETVIGFLGPGEILELLAEVAAPDTE